MNVSIIIVNYKTPQLCISAIDSIFEKTKGLEYEIIVVDNDSRDGSVEKLEAMFGSRIKVINSGSNLGFGRANNIGIENSSGEFVFLLNSDTLLRNNAIKILYDFIHSHENVGVVGANLFSATGNPIHSYIRDKLTLENEKTPGLITRIYRKLTFASNNREFNSTGKPLQIYGYITGADMMIRRTALEKSGQFDPEFFMYSEEAELTARIMKNGYLIWSVPDAEIYHLEHASFDPGRINEFKERCLLSGKCLLYEKLYGKDSVTDLLNVTVKNCKKKIRHSVILLRLKDVKYYNFIKSIAVEYISAIQRGEDPYRRQQCVR